MALVASYFTWVSVSRGMRTRIAQGPLVHGVPVQWLEFGNPGGRDTTVNFFATVYSAAAPWYLTTSGTAMAWRFFPDPYGITGGRILDMFPWDAGFPLWLSGSPWIEVYVTTDINCVAHLRLI